MDGRLRPGDAETKGRKADVNRPFAKTAATGPPKGHLTVLHTPQVRKVPFPSPSPLPRGEGETDGGDWTNAGGAPDEHPMRLPYSWGPG